MHALLLKRFFQKPLQIAYVVPSSRTLTRRVTDKMDLSCPRVIVEYGPGEGCHSREILSRMHPGSHLILIELDDELVQCLHKQFHNRSDVTIVHGSAADVVQILAQHGYSHCDYIVSGIPFSIIPPSLKQEILAVTSQALQPQPHSAFLVYQVTRELRDGGHCDQFARCETEFCLFNIPPMWISVFYRTAEAPASITTDFDPKSAMVEA
ncbi:MAG: rRNA adenine N-6-methyltransferase family protein [Verrucomicrobiota bacterium]